MYVQKWWNLFWSANTCFHSITSHNWPTEYATSAVFGMACFDHHRAEITVMQFTGHPLLVHQFMTAPWDFNLVPYCQLSSPTQSLPITGQRNMQLLLSLEWHVWPGWRSIYNSISSLITRISFLVFHHLAIVAFYPNIDKFSSQKIPGIPWQSLLWNIDSLLE